jgi:outer membrane protein OmpA-like peptidoglycan-associated protein
MTLATLLLIAAASAQDNTDIGVPEINAQLWRPPVDGTHTLWTLDSGMAPDGHFVARAMGSYAMDPLVVIFDSGERMELVSDVLQLDLMGAYTIGRVRLGLDMPVYLFTDGQIVDGSMGTGDVMIDLKGSILDRGEAAVGLALDGRLFVPTATVDLPLGTQGLGWELAAVVDKQIGPMLVAANLGTRGVPQVELSNVTVNDQLFYRLGGGYALSDAGGVSADLAGAVTYAEGFSNSASAPLEALLGGWGRVGGSTVIRGGVGTGLTQGIGSPVFRAILGVGYEPPLVRDTDGDGLVDSADACPEQPEDFDSWADSDGCPDPSVEVEVRLVNREGEIIEDAAGKLRGDAQGAEGFGAFEGMLHPGAYRLDASAPGYRAQDIPVTVPEQGPHVVELLLLPETGRMRVTVLGPDDAPIAAYLVIDKSDRAEVGKGGVEIELLPGAHELLVQAEGFALGRARADVVVDELSEVVVRLEATRVAVTHDKIEILEKVYFDTGKDTIKPESYPLLDEIVGILAERQDILRVRIEGHTDERGGASSNQGLSDRRAAAVRRYLEEKGIAAERLVSQGFGESKPVDPGHNAAAWDKNRRVEFMIEAWASDG